MHAFMAASAQGNRVQIGFRPSRAYLDATKRWVGPAFVEVKAQAAATPKAARVGPSLRPTPSLTGFSSSSGRRRPDIPILKEAKAEYAKLQ
jgi:hypothetical protein